MASTSTTLIANASIVALKARAVTGNAVSPAKEAVKCSAKDASRKPRTVAQAVPSENAALQEQALSMSAVSRRQMLSGGVALAVVAATFLDARPSYADEESEAEAEVAPVAEIAEEAAPAAEVEEEEIEAAPAAEVEEEEIEEEIAELEEKAAELEMEGEVEEAKVLTEELEVIEEELETAPRSFIQQALLALRRSFGLQ